METGSIADWVSGTGSWIAVVVALAGYGIVELHRRAEEKQRKQASAYQIGYKLATLTSDAVVTHKSLFPVGTTYADWKAVTDPFAVCGAQQAAVGFTSPTSRDLSDAEQNLLMTLREENFLMDFSETFARNESIRQGVLEYKARHEAITAKLPPPSITQDNVASHMLDEATKKALFPGVVMAATLMQSLREMSLANIKMLRGLCQSFHPMMAKHYPDLHIHKIEDVSGLVIEE